MVDVEFCNGQSADNVATFNDCLLNYEFSEGEPNTVTVSFVCYGGWGHPPSNTYACNQYFL